MHAYAQANTYTISLPLIRCCVRQHMYASVKRWRIFLDQQGQKIRCNFSAESCAYDVYSCWYFVVVVAVASFFIGLPAVGHSLLNTHIPNDYVTLIQTYAYARWFFLLTHARTRSILTVIRGWRALILSGECTACV